MRTGERGRHTRNEATNPASRGSGAGVLFGPSAGAVSLHGPLSAKETRKGGVHAHWMDAGMSTYGPTKPIMLLRRACRVRTLIHSMELLPELLCWQARAQAHRRGAPTHAPRTRARTRVRAKKHMHSRTDARTHSLTHSLTRTHTHARASCRSPRIRDTLLVRSADALPARSTFGLKAKHELLQNASRQPLCIAAS